MAGHLILSAPSSGVKVRLASRRDFNHVLMAGDVIWCAGNELELAEGGAGNAGLAVCYLTNLDESAERQPPSQPPSQPQPTPPSRTPLFLPIDSDAEDDIVVPTPIPTAQLLGSAAFMAARAEALRKAKRPAEPSALIPLPGTALVSPLRPLSGLPAQTKPSATPIVAKSPPRPPALSHARPSKPLASLNLNSPRSRARQQPYPLPPRPTVHVLGSRKAYEMGRSVRGVGSGRQAKWR